MTHQQQGGPPPGYAKAASPDTFDPAVNGVKSGQATQAALPVGPLDFSNTLSERSSRPFWVWAWAGAGMCLTWARADWILPREVPRACRAREGATGRPEGQFPGQPGLSSNRQQGPRKPWEANVCHGGGGREKLEHTANPEGPRVARLWVFGCSCGL